MSLTHCKSQSSLSDRTHPPRAYYLSRALRVNFALQPAFTKWSLRQPVVRRHLLCNKCDSCGSVGGQSCPAELQGFRSVACRFSRPCAPAAGRPLPPPGGPLYQYTSCFPLAACVGCYINNNKNNSENQVLKQERMQSLRQQRNKVRHVSPRGSLTMNASTEVQCEEPEE